jgi:hypothetical protein
MADFLDLDPRAPERYRIIVSATWARRNPGTPETTGLLLQYGDNPFFQQMYHMVEDNTETLRDKLRKRFGYKDEA